MKEHLLPNYIFNIEPFAHQKRAILTQQQISLAKGKWTCLIGPSGVGKSTLLRCLAGLQGRYNSIPTQLSIGYMAQQDLLLPWLTALDNVLIGQRLRKEACNYDKALDLLKQMGLEAFAKSYPHQLSLGMRQRVALARTLMEDNDIILMDEPFSALDAKTKEEIQDYALKVLQGKTVFLVTHDIGEVLRLADFVYLLKGSPASLEKVEFEDGVKYLNIPRTINNPALWQKTTSVLSSLYS